MQTTTAIKLDLASNNSPPTVYAKQNDKGSRYVSVTLLENGSAYTIEAETTARIRILKPDNTAIYNTATINNGAVIAELTSQALAVEGVAIAEIGLYKDEQILTTFIFYVRIERSAIPDSEIESRDEFTVLETAIREANSAVSIAETAATTANTAASGADAAAGRADTATASANTAAARANAAAEAVGEAIDGIVLKSLDTETTYIVKFRIEGGRPYALCDTL